jgi:hypothetical protein
MTGQDGVAHLSDIDTALRRETDVLCDRFPDAPREEVGQLVRGTYEALMRDAEVDVHVLSLTRPRVMEQLRERGYALHDLKAEGH